MSRRFLPVRKNHESHLKSAESFFNKNQRISKTHIVSNSGTGNMYHLDEHIGYWMDSNKVNDGPTGSNSMFPVGVFQNLYLHIYQSFRDQPFTSAIKLIIGISIIFIVFKNGSIKTSKYKR